MTSKIEEEEEDIWKKIDDMLYESEKNERGKKK